MLALRLPFAAGSGVLVALAVFTVLWRFVNVPMDVSVVETERVNFTRQIIEYPIETTRNPKIERTQPPLIPEPTDIGPGDPTIDRPTRIPTQFTPTIIDDGGLRLGGTDHDPIPMVRVPPEYPPSAIVRGIEGWVQVQFSITVAGTVKDATVVDADPPKVFDQAALKAIARWRYSPRVVDGAAAERVGLQTVIRFNLDDLR